MRTISVKTILSGLALTLALALGTSAGLAQDDGGGDKGRDVPALDHVFVLVLENHNAYKSFGSSGILDNPNALKKLCVDVRFRRC